MDGWKTSFLLGPGLFSGAMFVYKSVPGFNSGFVQPFFCAPGLSPRTLAPRFTLYSSSSHKPSEDDNDDGIDDDNDDDENHHHHHHHHELHILPYKKSLNHMFFNTYLSQIPSSNAVDSRRFGDIIGDLHQQHEWTSM